MKRLTFVVYILIALSVFWYCGSDDDNTASDSSTTTTNTSGGTNSSGWVYGGYGPEYAYNMIPTSSGYAIVGTAYIYPATGTSNDVWLLEISTNGQVISSNIYGGNGNDSGVDISPAFGGGYVIAGITGSYGSGGDDAWVICIDESGNIVWTNTYGGAERDEFNSISPTPDSNYIAVGTTDSYGAGFSDIWVVKIATNGSVIWQKTFGQSSADNGYGVAVMPNGDYLVAGYSTYTTNKDFYIVRLDSDGNTIWQTNFGTSNDDEIKAVVVDSSNNILIAGTTASDNGTTDIYVAKLSDSGSIVWTKTYGGIYSEIAYSITPTPDDGCIVAGYSSSDNGGDALIIKLDSSGAISWAKTYGGEGNDCANSIIAIPNNYYVVAGYKESDNNTSWNFWIFILDNNGNIIN